MTDEWDGEGIPPIDPKLSRRIGEAIAARLAAGLLTYDDVKQIEETR